MRKTEVSVKASTCPLGTCDVTILRVSLGWWCSGVHVRLMVLVVLPY